MELRLGFVYGGRMILLMVFFRWVMDWGFLVRWDLRYWLLWFGVWGSWIAVLDWLFGEVGAEVYVGCDGLGARGWCMFRQNGNGHC